MDIALNLVNNSNDQNNSQIVVFQKNLVDSFDELPVAWMVIHNLGQGDIHPFIFPMTMQIGASDSWGNHTPQLDARNGQLFQMSLTSSGDRLIPAGAGTSAKEVQLLNALQKGAVNASIYKAGRLLALKTSLAPQQKAAFEFKPTIWIGAVSQMVQGQVMNSAIVSSVTTELSLLGVARADIVMTGGGPGAKSQPLHFHLENIVGT